MSETNQKYTNPTGGSHNHFLIGITGKSFIIGCSLLAFSLMFSTAMMSRAILKSSGRYSPLWSDQNVITQQEYDAAQREFGLQQ